MLKLSVAFLFVFFFYVKRSPAANFQRQTEKGSIQVRLSRTKLSKTVSTEKQATSRSFGQL